MQAGLDLANLDPMAACLAPYSSIGAKHSLTASVSRFFLEAPVVACINAGLASDTIDLGQSDVGRRYVGLDPSLPIVLSCAGMRWPRRPKLRSPCCAYDEGRDYWDLATLEIQTFRPMRCSRAQAGRLHTTCVLGMRERSAGKLLLLCY